MGLEEIIETKKEPKVVDSYLTHSEFEEKLSSQMDPVSCFMDTFHYLKEVGYHFHKRISQVIMFNKLIVSYSKLPS